MRVLHLFKFLAHGGAEMRMLDRMRFPSMRAFDHHLCILSGRRGPLDPEFERLGATIHLCSMDTSFPLRFHQLLKRLEPQVVHANQQWASAAFLTQARAAGVPGRVCQFHASQDIVLRSTTRRVRDRALRRTLRHSATAITGVSEGVMDNLWYADWRNDRRCSVEYLGVDVDAYDMPRRRRALRAELGLPRSARIAIHIGNMGRPKNHPGLGTLFRAMASSDRTLHLLVVGRRNESIEARFLANAGESASRVHILGARFDVPRLLLGSDVFLLPSISEGLPTVVLEARAAGLPAVVSNLTGNLEIARHLDRVVCLDPTETDRWVEAVRDAVQLGPEDHRGTGNPLRQTVFDAMVSAEAHADLWRRSVQ